MLLWAAARAPAADPEAGAARPASQTLCAPALGPPHRPRPRGGLTNPWLRWTGLSVDGQGHRGIPGICFIFAQSKENGSVRGLVYFPFGEFILQVHEPGARLDHRSPQSPYLQVHFPLRITGH